ncbi:hypothetical protein KKH43_05475 [Patescibacteria group bacterium]|nr:hypothetical protein [Patescibacteria group bacterium]
MSSKVFISCGQNSSDEKKIASRVFSWLKSEGFDPYIAIEAQSIEDLNLRIIEQLKNSDYYIFIDFCREEIELENEGQKIKTYRGSLFTNQELAISYELGFEKAIFLQHSEIVQEGLLKYILANPIQFSKNSDVLDIIKNEVNKREWKHTYSRHLIERKLRWSDELIVYRDHTGSYIVKILYIDIHNERQDKAAFSTVARLNSIVSLTQTELSFDRSHLKATGQPGYTHIIWPKDHVSFDLIMVDGNDPSKIYLNSALDMLPRKPIIVASGKYLLNFSVLSTDFPVLNFSIDLKVTGRLDDVEAKVRT